MIGTFWNLCRACPSMPVDKLHSEYRSTYRWHEYTGPRQEVVRKPPQPVPGNKEEEETKAQENVSAPPPSAGGGLEPALPRRKKNPSLAYRTHDLLKNDSASLDRARCADRDRERSGRRSKSEGPPLPPSSPPAQPRVLRSDSDPSQFAQDLMCTLPSEGGGLKQAISRISTEYRLQFAWPRGKRGTEEESSGPPRKSLSMGAIKPVVQNQQQSSVGQQIQNQPAPVHKKRITQADKTAGTAELEPLVSNQDDYSGEEKIVQETFSKGEKMQLSDNVEFKTEYKKKFRPFSQYDYIEGRFKPKKEHEPQIVPEIDNEHGDSWFSEVIELRKKAGEYKNEKFDDMKKDIPPRSRIDHFIRHHLERTTGVGEEGILHSPTREKLEPVIIRRKDTNADNTRSPQKVQSYTGRSQSAGPNTGSGENRSPKRTPRPPKPAPAEKRQRPKEKAADEVETSEAEILEPVVKSPPEPTRVKSPEQVLMRSPEPVNWTVPLDTGKTFTVTQNVSEGETLCRPHSESKMRSETMEAPPPPPQSAPPAFTDDSEWKKEEVKKSYDKPVPGTTLRCLDDPSFTFDTSSHEQKSSADVLEKAHSRFDQFWGKTNQENLDNQGQV